MRPPEHWHLRRPRHRSWRLIALLSGIALAVTFVALWCRPGGANDTTTATTSGNHCSSTGPCTPGNPSRTYGSDAPPPAVRGRAAALIEASCAAELYAKNGAVRLPPASLTKMMTALVAAQRVELSRVFEIQVNSGLMVASTGSTVMGLEPGMRMSLRDLLYGMLLPSGNDAAVEIAQDVAGSEAAFVGLMNQQAQQLGLLNTHFANPHGLDQAGLYTSALDIALLGRAVVADPALATIVRTRTYQPDWDGAAVTNGNELLERYPGAIGVKTGYTEQAGQTIVAAAQRNGRTLIVSVLGSYDRYADAMALFDWAFTSTQPGC